MIQTKQSGYILLESLVGLVILSTVIISMVHLLPIMIQTKEKLDIEKSIYNTLYEIADQKKFYQKRYSNQILFDHPIPYTVFPNETQLCATYIWRDQNEKKICL